MKVDPGMMALAEMCFISV